MKSVIWKFPIPVEGTFTLDLPEGPYRPLAVQMQRAHKGVSAELPNLPFLADNVAVLWIRVSADPNALKTKRRFHVIPTGQPFDDEALLYVGTFQPSANEVFHLFQAQAQ